MASADLEYAEDLLRQGRYPEAIERFRELLSASPERAELRGRVAEAYRLAGNPERAFHHFHKAATLFSRDKDLLGAARMLEAANQLSPNEPDVLFRLAEVLEKLGQDRPRRAVLRNLVRVADAPGDRRRLYALEALLKLEPQDIDLRVEQARGLVEVGRAAEAVALYTKLADHLARRDVDFAPWLARAAEAAPDRVDLGVQLAQLLLRHGRAREALGLLVPYYERFCDEIPLLEALLDALRAIGAKEKLLPASIELLKARTRQGQRTPALEQIQSLLAQAPNDPRVLEVSAHACQAFGLTGEACRLWMALAQLYRQHGMAAERDRTLKRVLDAQANHEGALAMSVAAAREAGRVTEAETLSQRLADARAHGAPDLPDRSEQGLAPAPAAAEPTPIVTKPAVPVAVDEERTGPIPEAFAPEGTMVVRDTDVLEIEAETYTPAENSVRDSDVLDAFTSGDVTAANVPPPASQDGAFAPVQPKPIDDPFFLPEESVEAPEEATFRMDEDISAELAALRDDLDYPTATELEVEPVPRPRSRSRPSARLVSDLLEEMRSKKPQ